MILYLDMDDVVADWRTAAEDFLQLKFPNGDQWVRIPDEKWQELKRNSRFYKDLPLKEGAVDLVQYCRDAIYAGKIEDVRFLSAIPHNNDMPWAIQDKVWWAHHYFPGIPVFLGPYSHDKQDHCRPGDILIDDRTDNCLQWESRGGKAHIYRTWESCRDWLNSIL
jgi:5' nucleotidase, deoxy (Pyrimidine), cytosolic type C protein (NT5C)